MESLLDGKKSRKNMILFSSIFLNPQIQNHINDMCKTKRLASYIPAGMEFYPFNGDTYKKMGFEKSTRFSLGYDFDESRIDELLSSDMIHIGGGNTFLLRYLLDNRGLMPKLVDYVENGGLLIGNSAGSIVMCEDILIANIADDNFVDDNNYQGLGLVPFEVKPHFQAYIDDIKYYRLYSEVKNKTVYGIAESGAVIVKNGRVIEIGDVARMNGF